MIMQEEEKEEESLKLQIHQVNRDKSTMIKCFRNLQIFTE